MAKARIVLPSGAEVQIEGSPSEVAELIERFGVPSSKPEPKSKSQTKKGASGPKAKRGPKSLIEELIDEGFFAQRRTINQVQQELEKKGNIYALTHLSTPLLRLVRSRTLRRMKESDQWVYVNA